MEDLGVNRRIMGLNETGAEDGFIWLRIGTNGWLLCTW
jgi:hypothetical protein